MDELKRALIFAALMIAATVLAGCAEPALLSPGSSSSGQAYPIPLTHDVNVPKLEMSFKVPPTSAVTTLSLPDIRKKCETAVPCPADLSSLEPVLALATANVNGKIDPVTGNVVPTIVDHLVVALIFRDYDCVASGARSPVVQKCSGIQLIDALSGDFLGGGEGNYEMPSFS